jgi:hypothetical protein
MVELVRPEDGRDCPARKKAGQQTRSFSGWFVDVGFFAQMVELADTLDSGSSGRKVVQVQLLFWALRFCKGVSDFPVSLSLLYRY